MTVLLETEIPRTLDALITQFTAEAQSGTRIEAWLFEDAPARAAAERVLAEAGISARLHSAYKPLLHFMLDEAKLTDVTDILIRTPAHPGGSALRFRLECYPLAGMLGGVQITFAKSDAALDYEVTLKSADGAASLHKVFAPNRAFSDHLGRGTLAPCGWLRVWRGDALVEDARIETEFEAAFRVAMDAVVAHGWGERQPYFETLEITVETGGIERPLDYADECVSTREALHEDLYFSLLEVFQRHAGRPPGDRGVQPGQIVPDIRPGEGPTRVRVALLPGKAEPIATGAPALLETATRPLTPDEISGALTELGGTRFDGRSVQGRPVEATHIAGKSPGLVVSAAQHANETSGIVGALRAAKILAARGNVDFAVIPLSNPDGHALHHRLRRTHPRHMHHAARYTALGDDLEFRKVEPLFEKATRLEAYRRTRAGLHLNLHGYPSHEWTRPLTGYAPVGFEIVGCAAWILPDRATRAGSRQIRRRVPARAHGAHRRGSRFACLQRAASRNICGAHRDAADPDPPFHSVRRLSSGIAGCAVYAYHRIPR